MMQPMPRVPPFDRPATYEDLVKLPDHLVAEIVDGELHASPKPAPAHAIAGASVGGLLKNPYSFGKGGPGGWWILYEPELHAGDEVVRAEPFGAIDLELALLWSDPPSPA